MEDSMGALLIAYEELRDRYNSLKSQYKKLVSSKNCGCCTEALNRKANSDRNLHLDLSNVSEVKSFETPVRALNAAVNCTSPETALLIREATQIREKLARALSSSSDESDISSLTFTVASLCELKSLISPDLKRFEKGRLSSEGTPVSCGDSLSVLPRDPNISYATPIHNSDDLVDYSLWIDSVNSVSELATAQHDKLEAMYQKISHQNQTLRTLIKHWEELESTHQSIPVHGENDEIITDDWSIVPSRM